MTAPSYTTDLTSNVITTCESITNWQRWRGTWTGGGNTPVQDGEAVIQGTYCISKTFNSAATRGGLNFNYGSGITFGTDEVIFAWHNFAMAQAPQSEANGGIAFAVGSSDKDAKAWYLNGSDRHEYGGWRCYVIDHAQTADASIGTAPTNGNYQYFGFADILTSAVSKGEPFSTDAMRYGRGAAIFEYGDVTNGYATIAGFAAQNDSSSNRWGLIQSTDGGYLWQGLMSLGTATNAVDFRDEDRIIFINYTPKVYANFNTIEIVNSSSRVDMTGFQFICLDPTNTASKGRWITTDDCDVNLQSCTFTDMATFTFGATTSALDCKWVRCGLITAAGADLTGSTIDSSTVAADASALNWNVNADPDGDLDDMTFIKGTNAHHAIEFGTSAATTINLRGWTTSGFNASDGQNDSTLYFADRGSDTTWTVNVYGGSGNFSYKKARAGDTVNLTIDPVTTSVKAFVALTGAAIEGVAVTLKTAGSGPYPYNLSITSLTQTGGTATADCASAHNLTTGDKVEIEGASPNAYNRIKTVTVTDSDSFTFPIDSGTSSPATGTITCSLVLIDELTPASGIVTDSRVFSSNQNVSGFAAKGTKSPLYKRQPISGTVDKDDGVSLQAPMTSDEE